MNWVAKLQVNSEDAYAIGAYDNYQWHRRIWDCFPDCPDMKRDFLFRIEYRQDIFTILLISRTEPRKPTWCKNGNFHARKLPDTYFSFTQYYFELRANPTLKKIQKDSKGEFLLNEAGKRRQGKRIPLVHEDVLLKWMERKAESSGFGIDGKLVIGHTTRYPFVKKEHCGYHSGVDYKGFLVVKNREKFKSAFENGIGSAKSFGFGMLIIVPKN